MARSPSPDPAALLQLLYMRPGFLLRRAHQLSVGLFEEELREPALTPPQYGVLLVLQQTGGCSQATVARALGFDRVTTLRVVRGLEARGLVARADGARPTLHLTPDGTDTLARARVLAEGVTRRLMAPLQPAERTALVELLRKLCAGLDPVARTQLLPPAP